MHSIWQDLRYGFRGLRKQLSFTLLAVLTLGLGIGAATTIFSVIQNVLLDPFPYMNVDRVMNVQIRDPARSRPGGRTFFRVPEFLDYQEIQSFEEVIAGGFEARWRSSIGPWPSAISGPTTRSGAASS